MSKDLRINRRIRAPKVRVVGSDGAMLGILNTREALEIAEEEGLDLVEVSPNAEPPVCKIINFGKMKYETQKKENIARKKQKNILLKEVKMSVNIGKGDYGTKLNNIKKFLEKGDKVKISFKFKGREITRPEIIEEMIENIIEETSEISKVEVMPRMEGRNMFLILASNITK
ncbi:translation initiation factor IF-3 [Pseudomonadota bacterium]